MEGFQSNCWGFSSNRRMLNLNVSIYLSVFELSYSVSVVPCAGVSFFLFLCKQVRLSISIYIYFVLKLIRTN